MTWIKLDDRAPRHPKIEDLSDRAFRWWIRGLCYASEFLTDGFLPLSFLRKVQGSVVDELAAAGLWKAGAGGADIHDYLEHQASREEVEAERERNRLRRRKRRGSTAGTPTGTPAGVPEPESREQRTESREERAAHTRDDAKPKHAPGPLAGSLPRDHITHGWCGVRFCVSSKVWADMTRRYGDGGELEVRAWLAQLEARIPADQSPGGPVWVLQQFDAWLVSMGRIPAVPSRPVSRTASQLAELRAKVASS